ncbi:hypothetical protein [Xenorhabdus hominickii]|uniref:50S ribosomal protein L7/L12 n=1 Tax=Xenorhabdus hominickii TaxID=351679 RepID=A0A2G0Q6Q7_XENHO|nr:hypothetical protein [Xenorhabdus hominickii]PHM54904.1 50S ribosomal protein L7/L12 [Xenorhabdus hominickii]
MDKDLIEEKEVFDMLGKKRTAVYRLRKNMDYLNQFSATPRPIQLFSYT